MGFMNSSFARILHPSEFICLYLVVGLADAVGSKAMVPTAADRGRGRPCLGLSETAFSLPIVEQAGDLHHPPQAGCSPLRACSSTPSRTKRKTAHKGRAPAQSVCGG